MIKLIKTEMIEKFLEENNLSKTRFCEICKIAPSTFQRIMRNQNVRVNALFKIAKVLKIPIYQIFNDVVKCEK